MSILTNVTPIKLSSWVFESIYPSYHKSDRCDRLHTSFENFEIPVEIKIKGDATIDEYRKFFRKKTGTCISGITVLLWLKFNSSSTQVQLKFDIKNPPKKVDFENSGLEAVYNANCSEIEQQITFAMSLLLVTSFFTQADSRCSGLVNLAL